MVLTRARWHLVLQVQAPNRHVPRTRCRPELVVTCSQTTGMKASLLQLQPGCSLPYWPQKHQAEELGRSREAAYSGRQDKNQTPGRLECWWAHHP